MIHKVTNPKFLGVIVDYLNCTTHISMVSQKISKLCGLISRIRNTLDVKFKKLIYYGLIHPYLTDCFNVWSSAYPTNLKTLCRAQKRSVRPLSLLLLSRHIREILSMKNSASWQTNVSTRRHRCLRGNQENWWQVNNSGNFPAQWLSQSWRC